MLQPGGLCRSLLVSLLSVKIIYACIACAAFSFFMTPISSSHPRRCFWFEQWCSDANARVYCRPSLCFTHRGGASESGIGKLSHPPSCFAIIGTAARYCGSRQPLRLFMRRPRLIFKALTTAISSACSSACVLESFMARSGLRSGTKCSARGPPSWGFRFIYYGVGYC